MCLPCDSVVWCNASRTKQRPGLVERAAARPARQGKFADSVLRHAEQERAVLAAAGSARGRCREQASRGGARGGVHSALLLSRREPGRRERRARTPTARARTCQKQQQRRKPPRDLASPTHRQQTCPASTQMRTKPLFGDGIGVEGFDAVAAMCDLTRFMSRPLFAAIDTQGRGVVTHTQFSRCVSRPERERAIERMPARLPLCCPSRSLMQDR